jgi:hypothetical protein
MSETTSIQIAKETRDSLKEIGSMGDDYNKVIKMLIEEHWEKVGRENLEKMFEEGERLFKEHPEKFVRLV